MTNVDKNIQPEIDFPPLPEYEAIWVPVYWEPIMLSGEKICSLIAVLGFDGQILVQPLLRANVLVTLFADKALEAKGLVDFVVESLTRHLSGSEDFSTWAPPVGGFTIGRPRESRGQNVKDVFANAIPVCSSFSAIQQLAEVETAQANEVNLDRWKAALRKNIIHQLPRLADSFDRPFMIKEGARKTHIDFVGQRLAANFGRLHSSRLSQCVRDSKAQILDLVSLRDQMGLFDGEETYQLIVWRPTEKTNFDLSKKRLLSINEALLELEAEADRFDLRVKGYDDPLLAARDLCQIEVAA